MLQHLKPKLGPDFDVNDHVYVDNNLVKLQVFFKDIVYKEYVESPSYLVSLMHEKRTTRYCIWWVVTGQNTALIHWYLSIRQSGSVSPDIMAWSLPFPASQCHTFDFKNASELLVFQQYIAWGWIGFCYTGCISLCIYTSLDLVVSVCIFVFVFYTAYVVLLTAQWGGPNGIEAWSLGLLFLQCFDTVGCVFWPIKPVPDMTHNVFGGMLNLAQFLLSLRQSTFLPITLPFAFIIK